LIRSAPPTWPNFDLESFLVIDSRIPARKPDQPPREYKVGDRVLVSLASGRIEEAVIKATSLG